MDKKTKIFIIVTSIILAVIFFAILIAGYFFCRDNNVQSASAEVLPADVVLNQDYSFQCSIVNINALQNVTGTHSFQSASITLKFYGLYLGWTDFDCRYFDNSNSSYLYVYDQPSASINVDGTRRIRFNKNIGTMTLWQRSNNSWGSYLYQFESTDTIGCVISRSSVMVSDVYTYFLRYQLSVLDVSIVLTEVTSAVYWYNTVQQDYYWDYSDNVYEINVYNLNSTYDWSLIAYYSPDSINNMSIYGNDISSSDFPFGEIPQYIVFPLAGYWKLVIVYGDVENGVPLDSASSIEVTTGSDLVDPRGTYQDGYDLGYSVGEVAGYNVGADFGRNNNLISLVWATFKMPFELIFGTYDNVQQKWTNGLFTTTFLGVDLRAFALGIMSLILIIRILRIVLGGSK